jgi:fibronectin type 3 domain-containing protein
VGGNRSNGRGVLLHYSNGTWTSVTPPDVSSSWELSNVHFTSPSEGWAVGDKYTYDYELGVNEPFEGVLLHYSNGTWTSITPPDVSSFWWLNSVHFTSPSEGWAVGGDDSNGRGVLFRRSTPPSAPTGISASDGTYMDKVEVTWSASLGAESYKVYRATSSDTGATKTLLGTTTDTFFDDTTVVPQKTYYYWVKASNAIGTSEFSAYDKGYRSDGSPLLPTNISASDGIYTDRVEVTWTASLTAESYKVYRARSKDPGATKKLLGTTTDIFFNDTTAVPQKTYYYWVKALNAIGSSKFSAYDKGYRSDGSPLVPTNVSASDGIYTDRVEVTWTASLRAESYKVYRARSKDPGPTKKLLGTTTDILFNDTTAVPGKIYYYWVKASNTIGTSKFSAYDKGYR